MTINFLTLAPGVPYARHVFLLLRRPLTCVAVAVLFVLRALLMRRAEAGGAEALEMRLASRRRLIEATEAAWQAAVCVALQRVATFCVLASARSVT